MNCTVCYFLSRANPVPAAMDRMAGFLGTIRVLGTSRGFGYL